MASGFAHRVMLPPQQILFKAALGRALAPIIEGSGLSPNIVLERPKMASHGDAATNLAMQVAKPLKRNPRELATALCEALMSDPSLKGSLLYAEVAGPGFINLSVTDAVRQAVVADVLKAGASFGHSDAAQGEQVLIEFVSANPTGPLHLGHARQAALGDALAAIYTSQGYAVKREFYYNDAGEQINNLQASVSARLAGHQPGDPNWPEKAYNGDYIADIAESFQRRDTVTSDDRSVCASGDVSNLADVRDFAVAYLRREQDLDLAAFGVRFDHYFLESSLYTNGDVESTVSALKASGQTFEADGALWLKTTLYGDDKDRVMQKSEGGYTYFVPDVAYHVNKWRRGFHHAIDIQGSDHQSAVVRVRAGLQALAIGIDPHYPKYLLHKMVKVMRGGLEVKISKRAGSYVTLRDLIDWVGRDAVRFFLASRKAETEFIFDIDLALSQSEDNPVYYVQYAHARICSVVAQWQERYPGDADMSDLAEVDLASLTSASARALLARLAEYPAMLSDAARDMAPHQVAFYLKDLAADMHSQYNAERVLVEERPIRLARLALLVATRQVLKNGLALLGVSAPDKM
jgi:arginyl-tRNA synthetase